MDENFHFVYETDNYKIYYMRNDPIIHRLDGPAIEYKNGVNNHEWYYKGRRVNCSSQEKFEKLLKLKVFW